MKKIWRTIVAIVLVGATGHAWELKGHEIQARVAVHGLPPDVPLFLREAAEELAYVVNEPDRWRGDVPWYTRDPKVPLPLKQPALKALDHPNHWLAVERVNGSLPPTRYEFLFRLMGVPRVSDFRAAVFELGTAPYAIAEYAEMLTQSFRLWRQAPSSTEFERRIKRQMEQNIIHAAGVLAHYVTDTAQPLHTSLHNKGWKKGLPNPKGYAPEGNHIHERFESYVDRLIIHGAIRNADIAKHLGTSRVLGEWLAEAEGHIRSTHTHVERVFELDKWAPFWSGKEPAEAKEFAVARLTAGAEILRNAWYTAWRKSQE